MEPVIVKDDHSETIVECDLNNGADKLSGLSIRHAWDLDGGMSTNLFFNKEQALAIRDYINHMIENKLFAEDKPDSAIIARQLDSIEQRRLFNKYLAVGRSVWVLNHPDNKAMDRDDFIVVPVMTSPHLEEVHKAPITPEGWDVLGKGEVTDFHNGRILVQHALRCSIDEEYWLKNAKR